MESHQPGKRRISRRDFLKAGLLGGGATAVAATLVQGPAAAGHVHPLPVGVQPTPAPDSADHTGHHAAGQDHGGFGPIGEVDPAVNGFDPHLVLQDWDFGQVSTLPGGQTQRDYRIVAVDKEFEIAPGVVFPGWVYNGRVPGPTLRCVEGDHIRIEFFNGGSHPHTIHFHGIHSAAMDGVPGVGPGMIQPGASTVYEFDAFPFGCHLYHCHAIPLKRHIHKGLYGAFIIDPDPARHPGEDNHQARSRHHLSPENKDVNEMVMVMNAFDTDFDGENEVYAVNTVAFAYMNKPIVIRRDQRQRLYLVNLTEFDPINSFHLHANFFDYYDHGTTLKPTLHTVDTIMQCQAQRGILEFDFKGFEPGPYMFHAHQSEFAELGWMGFFEVQA